MSNGYFKVEMPKNEPVKAYLPGSPERASLKKELERQSAQVVQVPMIIGGKEVWTERKTKAVMPHDHAHVIAEADRKSTRLNSSHPNPSRMPSSA